MFRFHGVKREGGRCKPYARLAEYHFCGILKVSMSEKLGWNRVNFVLHPERTMCVRGLFYVNISLRRKI